MIINRSDDTHYGILHTFQYPVSREYHADADMSTAYNGSVE